MILLLFPRVSVYANRFRSVSILLIENCVILLFSIILFRPFLSINNSMYKKNDNQKFFFARKNELISENNTARL